MDYYPPPKYKRIIEPFAGSARYSLKYFDHDILLVDKYEVIVKVWHYLQNTTERDIMKLPILKAGYKINKDDFDCIEQFWLMGFIIHQGSSTPGLTTTSRAQDRMKKQIRNISKQLYKIKHWKIELGCYKDISNEEATWFIDPPYQFGGEHYKVSNKKIDYTHLASWCRERLGQVIVCENTKAGWLPFKPMVKMYGSMFFTTEALWSNLPTNYDWEQLTLEGLFP